MRTKTVFHLATTGLALVLAASLIACEDSDPLAPEGSTISISAEPDPINLLIGNTSKITARVFNASGVPVPDDTLVIFEASAGELTEIEVLTSGGAAITVLEVAGPGSTTIKAFSGGTNGTRQVNAVSGSVSTVTLTSPDPTIRLQCQDEVDLEGRATDSNGAGVANQQPTFSIVSSTPAGLTGNFTSTTTNATGNYTATFLISLNSCEDNCDQGGVCTLTIQATVLGVDSQQNLIIEETIP